MATCQSSPLSANLLFYLIVAALPCLLPLVNGDVNISLSLDHLPPLCQALPIEAAAGQPSGLCNHINFILCSSPPRFSPSCSADLPMRSTASIDELSHALSPSAVSGTNPAHTLTSSSLSKPSRRPRVFSFSSSLATQMTRSPFCWGGGLGAGEVGAVLFLKSCSIWRFVWLATLFGALVGALNPRYFNLS